MEKFKAYGVFGRHSHVFEFLRRHSAPTMFAAGFLFDFFTMQRIDAWLDLALQLAYLAGLTGLLVFQHREAEGKWVPGRVTRRGWRYNVEALHFLAEFVPTRLIEWRSIRGGYGIAQGGDFAGRVG